MVLLEAYVKGRCALNDPCRRVRSVQNVATDYDFIVVGGGAAGAIVAGRLSENPGFSVLLLEAGPEEPTISHVPSFYNAFWDDRRYDWSYRTVPEDYCLDEKGKGCQWPRGKVLGGSSVLSGMTYHRGHAADYEDWEKAGATGWSWKENLPYFYMTEGNKQIGTLVDRKYHSDKGPLPVQQFKYQPPFVYDLMAAMNETGIPIIKDLNDPNTPEGFTVAQKFTDGGQRYSTARAFLKPRQERPNLDVKLDAHVTRVLLHKRRAVGVEYLDGGEKRKVYARKEVILSAGSINSPQILMLSGIGPRETLEKFHIPVVADLPVGKGMRNHYGMRLHFRLTKLNNTRELDWNVLEQYLLKAEGPMTSTSITQLTGNLYSSLADRDREQPDIQLFFGSMYADVSRNGVIGELVDDKPLPISSSVVLLKPHVTGLVTLQSSDPLDPPLLYPGYFKHPNDYVMLRDGARYVKRIFESKTLKAFGAELDLARTSPCTRSGAPWSNGWLDCVAHLHTDPQNHQISTAAIGRVVDTQLRVSRVAGLRVIDASVIPTPVTGNPLGAIMMIAERGAKLMRDNWERNQ